MADASVPLAVRAVSKRRNREKWMRGLALAFFAIVLGSIVVYLRSVDWGPVLKAIRGYKLSTLAIAAALATLSCLVYASFDLLSRQQVKHPPSSRWAMAIAFISYTFNLNLGTLLGSVGMRLRLYPRVGVPPADVVRMVAMTTVTNWQGYFALTGLALLIEPPKTMPENWIVGPVAMQFLGAGMLALAFGYLGLCAFSKRRMFHIKSFHLRLPSLRMAVVQTGLAAVNWVLIALVPWVVLQGAVPASTAMVALLVACSAGALAHIPAGLGVIEVVLLAMLGKHVPTPHMVAGLLVYRAIYYLFPFLVGLLVFAVTEVALQGKRAPKAAR